MNKQTLIFVHGFAASKDIWENQTDHFKARGRDVFAIDLLGHGEAYKPEQTQDYTLAHVIRQFSTGINRFGLTGQTVLVGHSLGAYVIIKSLPSLNFPVSKLIFISPLLNKDQYPRLLMNTVRKPEKTAKMLRAASLKFLRFFVRFDKLNSKGVSEKLIEQVAVDYKRADPRTAYFLQDLKPIETFPIQIPILILVGSKDNIINPAMLQRLSIEFPSMRNEIIEDGGHTIHLTHPQKINRLIEDFLVEEV